MVQGKSEFLLSNDATNNCCPIPAPPPRKNTVYACWHELNCTCDNLPLLSQHSSYAVSGAAWTYRMCYMPAEYYNRVVFNVCCCGNGNCCDSNSDLGRLCAFCVSFPRAICCLTGATSALVAGTLGGMYDLVSCAPCRQSMDEIDEIDAGSYKALPNEPTEDSKEDKIKKQKIITTSIEAACKLLDGWIKNDNLPDILIYFSNPINLEIINSYEIYFRRIFLICLAIRYPDNKITLKERIQFIKLLVRNDSSVLNKYNSIEGEIPAALLEALRSEYVHSSELLELCCMLGANIHQPVGLWTDKSFPNFLQVWAYSDFQATNNDLLFYKLHILYYYQNQNRPEELVKFLKEEKQLGELDQQLRSITDKLAQGCDALTKSKKREGIRTYLNNELSENGIPRDIALIIAKYSGLYSPGERETKRTVEPTKISASVLISNHSKFITPAESKEERMLSKYQPLPEFVRLDPAPDRAASDTVMSMSA